MRGLPPLATTIALLALLPATVAGASTSGGTAASSGAGPDPDASLPKSESGSTGGARAPARSKSKSKSKSKRRRDRAPAVTVLSLRPTRFYYGGSTIIRYRVSDNSRAVDARLYISRVGYPRQRASVDLGRKLTGRTHAYRWHNERGLRGELTIKVWARDSSGNRVARTSERPGAVSARYMSHAFPIRGAFDFGGEGARFGAPRRTHTHQGQDMMAAEGTPVRAIRPGVISWRRYQAGGAGHYIVLDADGENRDYVYMHLQSGSITVEAGERVRAGQQIAAVGSTGSSSGPHLHFETWRGTWYDGGEAIDPLPSLRHWLRQSTATAVPARRSRAARR